MFERILVALDRSPFGDTLFKHALELAKIHDAKLMLLHVLTSEEEGSPIPIPTGADNIYWDSGVDFNIEDWKKEWDTFESECREKFRLHVSEANGENIPTEFRQKSGHAGRVICDCANSWNADLIVIGHRGHRGLKEWVLGSVSNYVLHHACCNVFTLKTEKEGI